MVADQFVVAALRTPAGRSTSDPCLKALAVFLLAATFLAVAAFRVGFLFFSFFVFDFGLEGLWIPHEDLLLCHLPHVLVLRGVRAAVAATVLAAILICSEALAIELQALRLSAVAAQGSQRLGFLRGAGEEVLGRQIRGCLLVLRDLLQDFLR